LGSDHQGRGADGHHQGGFDEGVHWREKKRELKCLMWACAQFSTSRGKREAEQAIVCRARQVFRVQRDSLSSVSGGAHPWGHGPPAAC
jgi:hypothetical protein